MTARRVHEMTFAQFGQTISPSWGIRLADPMHTPSDKLAWLGTVWKRADRRLKFSVSWCDSDLNGMLPPEAQRYQFDDSELRAPALALGLDPAEDADMVKTSELFATCKAWLCAVTVHCRNCATAGVPVGLAPDVLDDFVRLSCHWMRHPWIQESIQHHRKQSQLSKLTQANDVGKGSETSDDPRWPETKVIYGRSPDLTPQEAADAEAKKNSIGYWIEKFDFDSKKYSSKFEMIAWDAKDDIDVANSKIEGLRKLIEAQQAIIPGLQHIWLKNKRKDAQINGRSQAGRPRQLLQIQDVAHKFTAQWVQSLMVTLDAPSSAALETMLSKSAQRNWRRWLTGQAAPTPRTLEQLKDAQVTFGPLQGQWLPEINTTPTYSELLSLIRLTGKTTKATD